MFHIVLRIWLGLILFLVYETYGLGCRDENGNQVDWYYGYKMPSGARYFYISNGSTWISSSKTVTDNTSIFGKTISQIYNKNDVVAVLYNDEAPNGTTDATDGHTKGVVASSLESGFWLVHSVPHFPPSIENGNYLYPRTGIKYGQSFLCITMNKTNIELVGKQLLYNEPFVYSSQIPEIFRSSFPNIIRAAAMDKISTPPFMNKETITSSEGVMFQSYAKNRKFGMEIYEDWVAPDLETDLLVETWQNGPGKIHSDCTKPEQVLNIQAINIGNKKFVSRKDHSKWAVSNKNNHWICVGDINRAEHQKHRGGGTVCQNSENISKAYRDTISRTEPCLKIYLINLV